MISDTYDPFAPPNPALECGICTDPNPDGTKCPKCGMPACPECIAEGECCAWVQHEEQEEA